MSRSALAALAALTLAAACEPSRPRYREYIPGPGFREQMTAGLLTVTPDSVPVGDWVTLHATRSASPWVLSDTGGVPADAPCSRISPIEREFEVASKVRWTVTPEAGVSWNMPGPPDFERQIRFPRPGRYTLQATSEGCLGEFQSNAVVVEVR